MTPISGRVSCLPEAGWRPAELFRHASETHASELDRGSADSVPRRLRVGLRTVGGPHGGGPSSKESVPLSEARGDKRFCQARGERSSARHAPDVVLRAIGLASFALPYDGVDRDMKIETQHPRVPWSWAAWMTFPWLTHQYVELSSGAPLVFMMRRFIEDPALIALLSSLNIGFTFTVGVVTSYMSDRIWTRFGRRRPFLILGWLGVGTSMIFVPLANDIWSLAALIFLYQFCHDVAKPYEPLYNEVIPAQQRGRASTLRSIAQSLNGVFFNAVLLAQFDRSYDLGAWAGGWQIGGEAVIFWTCGAITLLSAVFLLVGVRERVPPGGPTREAFSARRFFRDVFGRREWWLVYLLYVCPIVAAGGAGTFHPLFQTEQLQFTKQQVGWLGGVILTLNLLLFVPLAGFLADRVSRLTLLRVALLGQPLCNFALFAVARASDYTLPLAVAGGFMAVSSAFLNCMYVVWGPLVYDYVPNDRFGTVSAGFSFVHGFASFVLVNAAGVWVKGFTAIAGPAGGSAFDYSSVFVLQLFGGIAAFGLATYFGREVRRGRIAVARTET